MHVVITGANRGIGQALLTRYQSRGDKTTGASRAGGALATLDVTDPASHEAFATQLADTPIDLLICNAGVYLDKGETLNDGYPAQKWADTFAANVTGVFMTIQSLLPNLRQANAAKVAIISSQMASHACTGRQLYLPRVQSRRLERRPKPQHRTGARRHCRGHLSSRVGQH